MLAYLMLRTFIKVTWGIFVRVQKKKKKNQFWWVCIKKKKEGKIGYGFYCVRYCAVLLEWLATVITKTWAPVE